MFSLEKLIRENIRNAKAYSSARDEYKGHEGIFLDANESPYNLAPESYNRYPDPLQTELKQAISKLKKVSREQIFLGNGSDEPIDLIFRAFCRPGVDNIIVMPPTYGMYEVCAGINDIGAKEVPLLKNFQINVPKTLETIDINTKAIFICSPNNPTGNILLAPDIKKIIENFEGLVVVDEAYIDFTPDASFLPQLLNYPNLIVLQTFSKGWGMANLRLGMAFAAKEIVSILNKIKYPYNINGQTQKIVLDRLRNSDAKEKKVKEILIEREKLKDGLLKLKAIVHVYPSDANFLLVRTVDALKVYKYLIENKIITRDRSKVMLCEDSIRITVGTPEENSILLNVLSKYKLS